MDIFQSEIFGEVKKPEAFDEIIKYINSITSDEYDVWIWRGQGNISWPIHSSAFRRLSLDNEDVTEKRMHYYEEELLERATHKGYRYLNGRELTDFELLARLRHHGASTRLIDGSRNLLIGLFFCIYDIPEETGLLIGFKTHYLGGYEGRPEFKNYAEKMNSIKDYDYPQTWEPSVTDVRVAAQHSQFLYSRISKKKTGSLEISDIEDSCICLAISPDLKRRSLDILNRIYDIRYITLFPDIEGFGYVNSYKIKRSESYRW
ncbi:MAG: FRG domain-containing protein [Candidatus Tenebribacter davisii]|nr:FRG domain-containing protein [Candidatus Tenebribacter davisii]